MTSHDYFYIQSCLCTKPVMSFMDDHLVHAHQKWLKIQICVPCIISSNPSLQKWLSMLTKISRISKTKVNVYFFLFCINTFNISPICCVVYFSFSDHHFHDYRSNFCNIEKKIITYIFHYFIISFTFNIQKQIKPHKKSRTILVDTICQLLLQNLIMK